MTGGPDGEDPPYGTGPDPRLVDGDEDTAEVAENLGLQGASAEHKQGTLAATKSKASRAHELQGQTKTALANGRTTPTTATESLEGRGVESGPGILRSPTSRGGIRLPNVARQTQPATSRPRTGTRAAGISTQPARAAKRDSPDPSSPTRSGPKEDGGPETGTGRAKRTKTGDGLGGTSRRRGDRDEGSAIYQWRISWQMPRWFFYSGASTDITNERRRSKDQLGNPMLVLSLPQAHLLTSS